MRAWPWTIDARTVVVSMIFGTLVGLVVKYILDKRYIFAFKAENSVHESTTFALYTMMGILTTALFWGFELGFHFAFTDPGMKYVGAGIGLALGYFVKFELDRRFVFVGQKK